MESLIAAAPALNVALAPVPEQTIEYDEEIVAGPRLIVELLENTGVTSSGLVYEGRERPQEGIVRVVGTGFTICAGLGLGDKVKFSKYAGSPTYSPEEGERLILAEKDILTFRHPKRASRAEGTNDALPPSASPPTLVEG